MQIISNVFGAYQTNCYIVKNNGSEFIIDPGDGAYKWVMQNTKNPKAILITHGHFDHLFDVALLKRELNLPIYMHKDDFFMVSLQSHIYNYLNFDVDFLVDESEFEIDGLKFKFHHFAGHTPGCCMIQVGDDVMFSGDFLFKDSIGRWDFEFSNGKDMIDSIIKCQNINKNFTIYPGHGASSTLDREKANFTHYISYIKSTL